MDLATLLQTSDILQAIIHTCRCFIFCPKMTRHFCSPTALIMISMDVVLQVRMNKYIFVENCSLRTPTVPRILFYSVSVGLAIGYCKTYALVHSSLGLYYEKFLTIRSCDISKSCMKKSLNLNTFNLFCVVGLIGWLVVLPTD